MREKQEHKRCGSARGMLCILPLAVRSMGAYVTLPLAFFLAVAPLGALAQRSPEDLLNPINNVGLLEPQSPPPPGGPVSYGWSGPAPNWRVGQWNMPGGALSPFAASTSSAGPAFTASSAEAQVMLIKTGNDVEVALSQDGTVLPCETKNGEPRESDLFLGPYNGHIRPPAVPGFSAFGRMKTPLSELANLVFTADISILEGLTKTSKGCAVNQGGALIGVVLGDVANARPETLFYQLALSKLCGPGTPSQVKLCQTMASVPTFYFKTNPYGVTEFLPQLGVTLMRSQERRNIDIDVLPGLKQVIAIAPPSVDRDLSHLSVVGFYFGQHIWGGVTLQSTWHNLHLMEQLK